MPASVGRPTRRRRSAAPSSEPAADAAPVPATTAARPRPFPRSLLLPGLSPYVEAAETRKKVPVWVIPVLIFLPFWAFYVGYLENPPAAPEGLAYEGAEIYSGRC